MRRSDIILVPPDRNVEREIEVSGRRIRGALGPVDYPEAIHVNVTCHESKHELVIDFVYPMGTSEPHEVVATSGGGKIKIGGESGRVLGLQVPIPGDLGRRLIDFLPIELKLRDLSTRAASLPARQRPARRMVHYETISSLLPDMGPSIRDRLDKLRAAQGATSTR